MYCKGDFVVLRFDWCREKRRDGDRGERRPEDISSRWNNELFWLMWGSLNLNRNMQLVLGIGGTDGVCWSLRFEHVSF